MDATKIIGLVLSQPETECYGLRQEATHALLALTRRSAEPALLEMAPALSDEPYAKVSGILDALCDRAVLCGVRAYAACAKSAPTTPVGRTVSLAELSASVDASLDEHTAAGRSFAAGVTLLGEQLAAAVSAFSALLGREAVEAFPALARHGELVASLVELHLTTGLAVEHSCRQLAGVEPPHAQPKAAPVMSTMTAVVSPPPAGEARPPAATIPVPPGSARETSQPTMSRDFMFRVGPQELPWPLDERCVCGRSLVSSMYCCDPQNPIELGYVRSKLGPGVVLQRACCGAQFEGFSCEACGRVYVWRLGTVATVQR